jgi:hypothetical protein
MQMAGERYGALAARLRVVLYATRWCWMGRRGREKGRRTERKGGNRRGRETEKEGGRDVDRSLI